MCAVSEVLFLTLSRQQWTTVSSNFVRFTLDMPGFKCVPHGLKIEITAVTWICVIILMYRYLRFCTDLKLDPYLSICMYERKGSPLKFHRAEKSVYVRQRRKRNRSMGCWTPKMTI